MASACAGHLCAPKATDAASVAAPAVRTERCRSGCAKSRRNVRQTLLTGWWSRVGMMQKRVGEVRHELEEELREQPDHVLAPTIKRRIQGRAGGKRVRSS
mmetsp:Transcript_16058/g.35966  ORF Transcript_16058/g.35966 Transcript_16058/m.35966 type:complete len:100 (-) Transcript_16058:201-500(-)